MEYARCIREIDEDLRQHFQIAQMIADLTKDYLAGVAGGIAVVLIGHPFDTVKTRLQTSPLGIYQGTVDCVMKTFQQEGAKGFYSGIGLFTYYSSKPPCCFTNCKRCTVDSFMLGVQTTQLIDKNVFQ